MNHQLGAIFLVGVLGMLHGGSAQAVEVPLINPGGELYDTSAGNVEIPLSPIPPGDGTGWNGTAPRVSGDSGVEGIANNPNSGDKRLAFGATEASAIDPEAAILFQQTGHLAAEGDQYELNFFGRGFFEYNIGTDAQASFFGYVDGSGALIQVDAMTHAEILGDAWMAAQHAFTVPAASLLIGESLVIGFFTNTGDGGGFSAVDDVSLTLVPEPASWTLGLIAGWVSWRCLRRSRERVRQETESITMRG